LLVPLVCFLASFGTASQAGADEVVLENGDRLTGEIQHVRDGKLSLKTPYSKDPVVIDFGSIQGLKTETSITVQLEDGSRVEGPAEMTEDGQVRIIPTGAGPVVIGDITAIKGINPPPDITYKGDLTAAAGYTTGNTETVNTNVDGKFVVRSKRQRGTLTGAWNYAEDTKTPSARNANGSFQYDFFFTKKLYGYANTLMEFDTFQDLAFRSTLGAGLGYQFLETSRTNLSAELGASWVHQNYYAPDNTYDPDYASGRWAINLEVKIIPDKIVLFHFDEGYFGFEDKEDLGYDFLLRTKTGLRFTLVKDFFTSIQVNVDYNNAPVQDKEKVDTAFLFGLGYAFDM